MLQPFVIGLPRFCPVGIIVPDHIPKIEVCFDEFPLGLRDFFFRHEYVIPDLLWMSSKKRGCFSFSIQLRIIILESLIGTLHVREQADTDGSHAQQQGDDKNRSLLSHECRYLRVLFYHFHEKQKRLINQILNQFSKCIDWPNSVSLFDLLRD